MVIQRGGGGRETGRRRKRRGEGGRGGRVEGGSRDGKNVCFDWIPGSFNAQVTSAMTDITKDRVEAS